MDNQEILKRAVEKAVKKGYAPTDDDKPVVSLEHTFNGCWFEAKNGVRSHLGLNDIIFDHEFAAKQDCFNYKNLLRR